MSLVRSVGVFVTAFLLAIALAIGLPVVSSAATVYYWSGATIQNQTKVSATTYMTGGGVSTPSFPRVRITQSGYGSNESYGSAGITHSGTTTYSYCQWRYDWYVGGPIDIDCRYYH